MTQTTGRIFDEFARLVNDAAGVAQGVRREAETLARAQMERFLRDADFVRRDEFDAVKDLAAAAKLESEKLAARVAELEALLKAKADAPAAAAETTPAGSSFGTAHHDTPASGGSYSGAPAGAPNPAQPYDESHGSGHMGGPSGGQGGAGFGPTPGAGPGPV